MKKVQAQRKFAQGVYLPTSTNINTVVDRRSDVGTGKDPKNVFHNNTSAKTLLDIVSFESVHKHKPIVVIKRLCEADLKVADDSEPVNINNNLQQPVIKKTKTMKISKFNSRTSTLNKSESMILRSRTRLANKSYPKKWDVKKLSNSFKKRSRRKKRTVEEYQSEDETPLKFLYKTSTSKEQAPSGNKGTTKFLSKASASKVEVLSSNKVTRKKQDRNRDITLKALSKSSTSKGPLMEFPSEVRGKESTSMKTRSTNNNTMDYFSDMEYAFDETEHNIDETEHNINEAEHNIYETEQYIDETEHNIDETEYNIMDDDEEYITESTNNCTIDNTANNSINKMDCKIEIVEHDITENPRAHLTSDISDLLNTDVVEKNNDTIVIQSVNPGLENSASNVVQSDTDYMEVESLNSDVENTGNELESVKSYTEKDPVTLISDEDLLDNSKEEISDDQISHEITQWLGVSHSDHEISEEAACAEPNLLGNSTENEGITQKRQTNKVCKAISTKNLCKMLTTYNNVDDFVDTIKEQFKTRCCKCINCNTIYRSCKIMKLLKSHEENFHCEHLCRLACIRKNDQELVTIDLTDSSGTKNPIVETNRNEYSLLAIIKQDLLGDSQNTIGYIKIKNLTRDIIIGMNKVIRGFSPISEHSSNDSNASSDAPIITSIRVLSRSNRGQEILNLQPGPSGSAAAVIRSKLVEAPVFNPTSEEFQDPVAYFEKIMPIAAKYGLCKVVPPADFRPACNLNDNMRFTVIHQYIARVFNRWGENTRELCAIRASAAAQRVAFARPPLVGGVEVDLVKMFKAVQREGGIKSLNKKKWQKIAEELNCTGVSNPDKVLDSLYLKCLVPYNSYSKRARQEYINDFEVLWRKRNQKMLERAMNPLHRQKRLLAEADTSSDEEVDDNSDPIMSSIIKDIEDCMVKGRSTDLGNFIRVARNASKIYCPKGNSAAQVETSYWNIVQNGNEHVRVDCASIDTGPEGYGFTKHQHEPYGTHPWNLKMLSQNKGNVLRLLGSVIGLTMPTLHVGMVYSTSCWHRDPHGLPWVEYLHEGAQKIWYAISDEESYRFRKAVENLSPTSCQNKSIWLPSDITMIPPKLLLENGVSLSKVVQNPGEFIIVFPKSYSCSISTGYTVSESVYFATNSWVNSIHQVFQELRDSCEPSMFSLEHLLISAAKDSRASPTMLQLVCTKLISIVNEEIDNRNKAKLKNLSASFSERRNNTSWNPQYDDECQICRTTLYLSRVKGVFQKSWAVCITHALRAIDDPKITKRNIDLYEFEIFFTNTELENIINVAKKRLVNFKPRRK